MAAKDLYPFEKEEIELCHCESEDEVLSTVFSDRLVDDNIAMSEWQFVGWFVQHLQVPHQ